MVAYEQDVADRLERAADRMANAGFAQEEQQYRDAAAAVRNGLPRERVAELEHHLLLHPQPRRLHRMSTLAAQGEYDTGGDTGDLGGGDSSADADSGAEQAGTDQLLSTAFSSGLSDPYDPAQAGWMALSDQVDPFTAMSGGTPDPFTAQQNGNPFTLTPDDLANANPYTTGINVDPSTGSQATESMTGGGSPTDTAPQTSFNAAAFGYAGSPTSILASPDLLAQNTATPGDQNVASDATSTGAEYGSLEVQGQSWAWTNFVQLGDTTYNVFASPDGTMTALQPSGGGAIVFVDSNGQINYSVSPSGGYYFQDLEISPSAPGTPLPPDFVPDPADTNQSVTSGPTAPPDTPTPDPPSSPGPTAVSDPNASVQPPDGSPQAGPSSLPPPSDPPDPSLDSTGDPARDSQMSESGAGISEEQREEENWGVAQSGMWDALVSMADTNPMSMALHSFGLPGMLDWAKSGPPAPTGNEARDAELLDNYQTGQIITMVVSLAAPIGAEGVLASAESAATKLPALEGAGMMGGGRLVGPTEQWLSAFGEDALGAETGNALPNLADGVPTGPSFEGVIDPAEFENDPTVIDRLSRAQAFDIGGYESLTARGEYGRLGDDLASDEALQNAWIRNETGGARMSEFTRENPAMALPTELHQQIQNLRVPQMAGMTPEQVLQFHVDQMYDIAPDYAVRTLEKESLRFIDENF